jgi:hypothetical protein
MSTGLRWVKFGGAVLLGAAVLCVGSLDWASAATSDHPQKKSKKQQPQLPPLPSGPTGRPVQPIPLDATPAVPPKVTYENNQLTIVAPNSTLADILRAVRKLTGAEIEIPSAPERVVTNLGPGPARSVVAELLNGSRFNYILLGSPGDSTALTRIVLVAKTGSQEVTPPAPPTPVLSQQVNMNNQAEEQAQAQEAEAADDSSDDNADQSEPEQQAEQPATQQDQNNIKTPQQMLQEMQQRQMQLQQQQGQPPAPAPSRPPGYPQNQ